MVRYISLIVAFLCLVSNAFSQEKKTYVFKDRYTKSVQNFINQSSHFEDIKIMTGNMLTSDKNKVDYKKVENNLKKLYPSENASGMLCIDLENSGYNALKGNSITRFKKVSDKQFKEAEKEFIQLIKFIKSKRPKLQVGYYGMPFKIYKASEKRTGSDKMLDNILKEADVLMPSFYMPYPAAHNGSAANQKYLEVNLKGALEAGNRLNKPVLPFFWYLIFSPEKKFSYELISKEEMKTYTDYILKYNLNGKEVIGIIWWDSATPFYKKNKGMIKQNYIESKHRKQDINQAELFYYYFK